MLVRGTVCRTVNKRHTSPEGVLEGRVVDSSDFPSPVNLKGLKVAPNSAIYIIVLVSVPCFDEAVGADIP